MKRRAFLVLGAGIVLPSLDATAQAAVRRIGLLTVNDIFSQQRDSIIAALADRGWVEGKNLHVVTRSAAGDQSRLRVLANEMVKLEVEAIIGIGTLPCQAAKAATSRIPIVMYGAGDPVGTGLIASLSRPGANVTGTSFAQAEQAIKRIEILREMLSPGSGIGFLVNAGNPVFALVREVEERTCRAMGLFAIHVDVHKGEDMIPAVTEVSRRKGKAVVVPSDPLFAAPMYWERVSSTARQLGLPIVFAGVAEEDGVLVGYSPDWSELDRSVAGFVDRILKGGNPATMAVELPSRYALSINLRTAKAAGLKVPQSLLVRADQVFR